MNRFPAGGFEVCHYEGDRLHRLDGPAYELCKPNGESKVEWWVEGRVHRLDGPARTEYRANGSVTEEHWLARGSLHRVNGPARISYESDGSAKASAHFLLGRCITDGVEAALAEMPAEEIERALRDSPFAELLDEGASVGTITGALASGVNSAEGMRQVIDGAPGEWVRSWESGAAAESRAAG